MFRIAILAATLFLCGQAAAGNEVNKLAALATTQYHEIASAEVGRPFHIYVRTPDGYDDAKSKLPVVFLLDGDVTFPIIASLQPLFQFDAPEIPAPIVVGVAYQSFDPANGNFRGVDFTTPAPGADQRGGAAAFQRFLKNELIPLVEREYRADPARRILMGQSRGGHFVLYSALTEPALFWGRIASNPAFSPAKDFLSASPDAPASASVSLYVSSAENDIPALRADALDWFRTSAAILPKPWRLKTVTLPGETHASGIVNVYRNGMRWLFENEPSKNADEKP